MATLVRSTGLSGYERLGRSIGLDTRRELQRVGLSSKALADHDALIPYAAVINLLEHSAQVSNCPDFGLRLSELQGIDILGPLAILIRHSPTLGEALQLASQFVFVHSPAIQLVIEPAPEDKACVNICFAVNMPHLPPCPQTIELSLGVMIRALRLIGGRSVEPLVALLPHRRLGPAASYARAYACECQFGYTMAAVRVQACSLEYALPEHNPMLLEMAQTYLSQQFGEPRLLLTDRVRALVRRFIAAGSITQISIAEALSIHPRTLQRRLSREGHNFEDIVDQVRRERFLALLDNPEPQPLSQIALMLGYSEQAAITRSCHRWFGCNPTEFQQRRSGAAKEASS
ncbi:AraC family transcriptional regulator [Paraburkholderia oxyphila]|uniref:AraC family transcriptional regulator n=1 Tax=Paraburkholderia oxyphila TaxID=614212 RepID=UPI0004842EAD|nr:AraC family transcriptional regulator [Paraburkholderia oxyphila]